MVTHSWVRYNDRMEMNRERPRGLTALVFGATGAIGEMIVEQLARHPGVQEIRTVSRRPLSLSSSIFQERGGAALTQFTEGIDFERAESFQEAITGADMVFCALGTTRADAGSAEAFIRIDQGYVLNIAEACARAKVRHFSYISSMRANPKSPLLYLRTKGQTEQHLTEMAFPSLIIARPGLLNRAHKSRSMEKIAWSLSWLIPSIHCRDVAKAVIALSFRAVQTPEHFDASSPFRSNRQLKELARGFPGEMAE